MTSINYVYAAGTMECHYRVIGTESQIEKTYKQILEEYPDENLVLTYYPAWGLPHGIRDLGYIVEIDHTFLEGLICELRTAGLPIPKLTGKVPEDIEACQYQLNYHRSLK